MEEEDRAERQGGAALIRDAAVLVLMSVGLRAATTRMVTDQAGVGRGLLNHYYRWPDLRAAAWEAIFDTATADQFPADQPPEEAFEAYLASAFAPEARPFWQLWSEATDLALTDPTLAAALHRTMNRMLGRMANCLSRGRDLLLWQLADPEETAVRLSALYDGLAGMLLADAPGLTMDKATAHLRHAFLAETRPAKP
jgi:AcrR family transcriptional regulator